VGDAITSDLIEAMEVLLTVRFHRQQLGLHPKSVARPFCNRSFRSCRNPLTHYQQNSTVGTEQSVPFCSLFGKKKLFSGGVAICLATISGTRCIKKPGSRGFSSSFRLLLKIQTALGV
jgi:hypothetical protein